VQDVLLTSACSPGSRVAAWNEAACANLTPMTVKPFRAGDFSGRMRRTQLDQIRAVDIVCDGAKVERSYDHVAQTRETVFTLDVQMQGESLVRQAGREARLKVGDFVLTDSTRPYEVTFEHSVVMRLLRVPSDVIKRFLGCPEEVVGIRIDGTCGVGRITSLYVQSLWRGGEAPAFFSGVAHLERATLELLASAYAEIREARAYRSSLATVHRIQIVEAIEARLEDSTLTPASLAKVLRITPRYLHRLFSVEGETVSRYILRRRLERCAQQLSAPSHFGRHISDIAFGAGFSTLSHFCRAFRDHYGLPPGDYRREHQNHR
jgi:AraC-like DNA-binding protein